MSCHKGQDLPAFLETFLYGWDGMCPLQGTAAGVWRYCQLSPTPYFKELFLLFKIMYVSVCLMSPCARGPPGPLRAGVTADSELPDMGTRNQIQILWKSCKFFEALNHLSCSLHLLRQT